MAKTNKNYFDSVDLRQDLSESESVLLKKWQDTGIIQKYLDLNKSSKKNFSFLDGPITANNPMGVHHAWGRTYKDLWQRYKNMKGFKQRFQNGFDAQGLWVEVEVEKELGFKNKKDIEQFGIAKFVDLCKQRVKKYASVQTEQSKRLGYFMDWDNSYYTLSENNNYLIWHFLKVCHQNGWLYRGNESVPWCPRCETAISQHEILTEDYKELSHESIVIKFPIVSKKDEYLLVWTTTPWTIPANIAIAVNKEIDYSLVQGNGKEKYWLAKDTIKRVLKKEIKPIKTVKGQKLVGLKYHGPFDDLPAVEKVAQKNKDKFHTVVATDERLMPVTTDEGTGMVHTAVSAGTEDYRLGKKLGLPMIPVIADDASYVKGLGFLTGKNAKDHPELILDYLSTKDKGRWVFDIFKYKHRYPCCWRCKEELVWKVTDEWYIGMDIKSSKNKNTLRERMIKVAKEITWIPSFGLKRELDWLTNMQDWLISKKNRYWGLALPIWECGKCGHFEVIGSREELEDKAVEGIDKLKGKSPHKPQIDEVKIKCEKCSNIISRIEPVGNPWLDAGIVAYSTISKSNKATAFEKSTEEPLYLKDKEEWRKWFPADFITESFPGQFKNWFYSLIAMSTVLENERPFKTIFGYATLFAENGQPMHKSWGNMIGFDEGAEKMGVDVMRWMYMKQNPMENLLFGYKKADETRRKFHIKLLNIYNYFVTYANLNNWIPKKDIEIKLDNLGALDKWMVVQTYGLIKSVEKYLDAYDPYNASIYIEEFIEDFSNWYIRRSRERVGANADLSDSEDFYKTTYWVLENLSRVIAPFVPFMSDIIYTNITKKQSVHLTKWPGFKESDIENNKKLVSDMKYIREIVEKVHAIRKEKEIPVRQPLNLLTVYRSKEVDIDQQLIKLLMEEINIKKVSFKKGNSKLILDTKITPKLKQEAQARLLVRNIQLERRKLNCSLKERVNVESDWIPTDLKLIKWIKEKTLTKTLKKGKTLKVNKYR